MCRHTLAIRCDQVDVSFRGTYEATVKTWLHHTQTTNYMWCLVNSRPGRGPVSCWLWTRRVPKWAPRGWDALKIVLGWDLCPADNRQHWWLMQCRYMWWDYCKKKPSPDGPDQCCPQTPLPQSKVCLFGVIYSLARLTFDTLWLSKISMPLFSNG
jgi:hypothetical protein